MFQEVARNAADASTAHDGHAASALQSWLGDLLLTLPFILLFWINLAHHQLWLDELNAWGLSVASPTLRSLFANVRYEGHPWLWYFILWIPARFTHSPLVLKWVAALCGAATYLVIGLLSPFTRLQKVLLFLSYFVAFEYTVISRTYGPMFLLALLYAWHRSRRPHHVVGNLLLLAALANTDLTGIMLSGALLLEYAVYQWMRRAEWLGHRGETRKITSGVLYLALLLFSIWTLLPAHDISWTTTGHPFARAKSMPHLVHALTDVTAAPWWPVLSNWPHEFWNTDADFNHLEIFCMPLILAGYYWIFRKRPSLLVMMATILLLALCFAHLVYIGFVRHWGITVAGFLVALWILRGESNSVRKMPLSRIAYVLLAIGALKGVASMAAAWTHPFSETENVANWLRQQHLTELPIVGSSDYYVAGVAEQLEKPAYFLNCNCIDTYMKFAHRRDGMEPGQIPERVALAAATLHVPEFILLQDKPLSPENMHRIADEGIGLQQLAIFGGSEEHYTYWIYRAQPQHTGTR